MDYKSFVDVVEEEVKKQYKTYILVKATFNTSGKDLMLKGGKFYAFFDPDEHLWTKDETKLIDFIDHQLDIFVDEKINKKIYVKADDGTIIRSADGSVVKKQYLRLSATQQLKEFRRWTINLPSDFNSKRNDLDRQITLPKEVPNLNLTDYRTKSLAYDIKKGSIKAYRKLMSVLYDPDELEKIEWSIGSVLAGESPKIDKMIIFYGPPGSGKSTVLDLIKTIFDGYWSVFSANELADRNYQFSTAMLKDNPLVAIQDDGSMAKIDSPVINSIVSHAEIQVNEKGKQQYTIKPVTMLFLATNEVVDLHDTYQGMVRRIIDIYPSGKTIEYEQYCDLRDQMYFEIPAIAYHCREVYQTLGKKKYIRYRPEKMIKKSNYIYNFCYENYDKLVENDPIYLSTLYKMYKEFCESSGLSFTVNKMKFGRQIREYYEIYAGDMITGIKKEDRKERFSGFKKEIFDGKEEEKEPDYISWIKFKEQPSLLDDVLKDCPAQYGKKDGSPAGYWANVTTTLKDLDTSRLHYVKVPDPTFIFFDFDLKDENGNKSFAKNLEAASKYPETYAELSKGGEGIHLHYIYDGDPNELEDHLDTDIEIKVLNGNAALRRRLSKCNDIPIATIDGSNLPKKKRKTAMINKETVRDEKRLKQFIFDCLNKKHHGATKPEVDFIKAKLDEYYNSGVSYDVRDLSTQILSFAMSSSHQSDKAVKVVNQMHFCSEEFEHAIEDDSRPIIFFDTEVFPNLFVLNWKYDNPNDKKVMRMINPTASEVEDIINNFRLVGFNNRKYDNHILYARMMGYSNKALYELSQSMINDKKGFFGNAYNLSYTDIYDFSNTKQSLKKWEIELGVHHQELGLPWDQPVPEELWSKVAEYCDNDVLATEAVFHHLSADWTARQILADISGLTVNDTTNSHTQAIIFGSVKHPQTEFVYTDLSEMFPGYKFENGKSTYRGEEVGEGGYVYAEPGIYENVALLDIASMHPTSLEQLNLFGPYTENFSAIKQARIYIKHEDYESAGNLFDGKLKPYLNDKGMATDLAFALKIAINSVYGLTSAKFENRCRDPRNVDNIVAKRGALFMINLKHEVQKCGFTVAHIKTDSIKIPNATPEIINFVMEYGKSYGYTFEHEATYDRMCLVNDAVYIAKYKGGKHDGEWTATGAEFQHPFIFKSLFSHEPIEFRDLCETKTVQTALYLDMNENLGEGEHNYIFVGRAGSFCPIKPGCGGGELMRLQGEKYYSATGTKGWRWLEAEDVAGHHEEDIDMRYFDKLCKDAIGHINEFGNFEEFAWGVNIEPREDFMNKPE